MYLSGNDLGFLPALPGAISAAGSIASAGSTFASIFGGSSGPSRAEKAAMAKGQASKISTSLGDINQLIKHIEDFLADRTLYFGCSPDAKSVQARACWIAICEAATQAGWKHPQVKSCEPYEGKEKGSKEARIQSLKQFFQGMLPKLRQQAARESGASIGGFQISPLAIGAGLLAFLALR